MKVIKTTVEDKCVNQIRGAMPISELRKYLSQIAVDRNKDYQRKLQQIKFENQALLKKQALERAQQKLLQTSSKPQNSS